MKVYKVKISPQAREHLNQIRDYIAFELLLPSTAKKILELIHDKIGSLSTFPERNPLIREEPWGKKGIRKIIVKNFYVYYMISESEKTVKVIAIIYGKRDQDYRLGKLDV